MIFDFFALVFDAVLNLFNHTNPLIRVVTMILGLNKQAIKRFHIAQAWKAALEELQVNQAILGNITSMLIPIEFFPGNNYVVTFRNDSNEKVQKHDQPNYDV